MSQQRTIETLEPLDCYGFLRQCYVGRLGYVREGRAVIVPVNYRLDADHRIVIRSSAGEKLEAARGGEILSLQVDGADELYHTGWSVLASGPSEEVTDPEELRGLSDLLLRPWAAEAAEGCWIRIRPDTITGRRLG